MAVMDFLFDFQSINDNFFVSLSAPSFPEILIYAYERINFNLSKWLEGNICFLVFSTSQSNKEGPKKCQRLKCNAKMGNHKLVGKLY